MVQRSLEDRERRGLVGAGAAKGAAPRNATVRNGAGCCGGGGGRRGPEDGQDGVGDGVRIGIASGFIEPPARDDVGGPVLRRAMVDEALRVLEPGCLATGLGPLLGLVVRPAEERFEDAAP